MEQERQFTLYGRDVRIPEKSFLFYKLSDRIEPVLLAQKKQYMQFYSASSIEKYLRNYAAETRRMLLPVCELAVKMLTEHKNFDYTAQSMLEETFEDEGRHWDRVNEELADFLDEINDDLQGNREIRDYNKRNRSRAYGYGTLDSYAAAGLKNAATGAFHGIKNSVGNAVDSAGASMLKSNKMKEMQEKIEDALDDLLANPFIIVMTELDLDAAGLNREQIARLENLPHMPAEQAIDTALALLPGNIREKRIYAFLLRTQKDPDGKLDELAKAAGVDLTAERNILLAQAFQKLPTATLDETRASIARYREELAQYHGAEDESLKQLLEKEKQQFTEACTFNGTVYDSIEERQEAEKRYEWEKEHFDEIAPEIDGQIGKLPLCYTPECREAARQLHDTLEKRYAGLARTPKMLELKQFLYLYDRYEKDCEDAQLRKLSIPLVAAAGLTAVAVAAWGIIKAPPVWLCWILAAMCGLFVYMHVCRFAVRFKGNIAQAALESQAAFVPCETLEYTGKSNYSLDHKNNAPAPELKRMSIITAVCTAAAVLAVGFSSTLHGLIFPMLGIESPAAPASSAVSDDGFYAAGGRADRPSASSHNSQPASDPQPQPEPAYSAPAQEPPEKEAEPIDISVFPALDADDAALYLHGYYHDVSEGVDGVYLYADSTVTLSDMLHAVLGDFEWQDSSDPQQDAVVSDMYFQMDATPYMLRVNDYMGFVSIEGYYEAAGTYRDSEYNTADLIYRLCQYYHTSVSGTAQSSWVRMVRGDWQSDDGTVELTIDASSYGGNEYRINNVGDRWVWVSITRNSGRIDDRVLYLYTDDRLEIYEAQAMGTRGELVGIFERTG